MVNDIREDRMNDTNAHQKYAIGTLLPASSPPKGMTYDAFLNMVLTLYVVLVEGLRWIAIFDDSFTTILNGTQKSGINVPVVQSQQPSTSAQDSEAAAASIQLNTEVLSNQDAPAANKKTEMTSGSMAVGATKERTMLNSGLCGLWCKGSPMTTVGPKTIIWITFQWCLSLPCLSK